MKNKYEIRGEETAIFLVKRSGEVLESIIDTEDLEKAKGFHNSWLPYYSIFTKTYYVRGIITLHTETGVKRAEVHLHRYLLDVPKKLRVDHINHDTLCNRKHNLRKVNASENAQNRTSGNRNNVLGIRGVYLEKKSGKYKAQINIGGVRKNLGRFDDINKAKEAFETAKEKYYIKSP